MIILSSISSGLTGFDQSPAGNGHGDVAFKASRSPQGGEGIFLANARRVISFVDSSGLFHVFSGGPSINSSNTVVFHAVLDSGVSGIFKASPEEKVSIVVTDSGAFAAVQRPTINDRGEIAFLGTLVGGIYGIFTGPNAERDKVVAVGDTIDGFRVDGLNFFRGLNDKGEIVFAGFSNDGTQCLFRARPHRR